MIKNYQFKSNITIFGVKLKAKLLGELCTSGEILNGGPPLQQAIKATKRQLALVKDHGGLASLQPPDSEVSVFIIKRFTCVLPCHYECVCFRMIKEEVVVDGYEELCVEVAASETQPEVQFL